MGVFSKGGCACKSSRALRRECERKGFRAMVGFTIGAIALGACFADVTAPGTDPRAAGLVITGDSVVVLSDSTSLVIATPDGGPAACAGSRVTPR